MTTGRGLHSSQRDVYVSERRCCSFLSFSGSGDKLGDIPRTSYQITKMKPADLKPLHAILFDRPGKVRTFKGKTEIGFKSRITQSKSH